LILSRRSGGRDRRFCRSAQPKSASSIQQVDSDDSIAACQQDAADFFDSIGQGLPSRFPHRTFQWHHFTLPEIGLLLRYARSYGDTTALSFEASNRSISILAR
jgi:hypothetical protein